MKKILLACSVVLMFACSNENDVETTPMENTTENTIKTVSSVNVDFDIIFNDYVNSNSFLQLNQKVKQFSGLLKYTGDLTLIDTEVELFSWISANLSNTDFVSVGDAEARWQEIEDLQEADFVQNSIFYQSIPANRVRLAELWLDFNLNISGNNEPCKDDLLECNEGAASNYADSMSSALQDLEDGLVDSEKANNTMKEARVIYDVALTCCKDDYEKCLLG